MVVLSILEKLFGGKVHILVTVGNKPAAEVILEDNEIILEIKNPILALQAGVEEMIKRGHEMAADSENLEKLKKMGYKIKLRYKSLEFNL